VAVHTLIAIEMVGPAASSGTAAANRQQPGTLRALSTSSPAP
jgi:hypothetical protein